MRFAIFAKRPVDVALVRGLERRLGVVSARLEARVTIKPDVDGVASCRRRLLLIGYDPGPGVVPDEIVARFGGFLDVLLGNNVILGGRWQIHALKPLLARGIQ